MDKAQLGEYNFFMVGDASGSMTTQDMKGRTRWDYMRESFLTFSREFNKIDSDGIGVCLFSGKAINAKDNCTPEDVENLFAVTKPGSSTPLAQAIQKVLQMAATSKKKAYIQVWTDGVPDDPQAVEEVIRAQAQAQQSDEDCTIQFVQVGYDKGATAYLQQLDNLTGAKFDIVNVVTIDEAEKFDDIVDLINTGIAG